MPKYTVIAEPLDHDGKRLVNGDTVDLPAKTGDRLVDEGILAEGKVKVEKPDGDDAQA